MLPSFLSKIMESNKLTSCQTNKQNNGFTLLELLVYVAILSVVTIILSDIFISFSRGRGQSEAYSEVNSNIMFTIEKISQDLRSATSSVAITMPISTSTPTNILSAVVGASTITYATSTAGQLLRTVGSDSYSITSDLVNVDALTFKRLENINPVFGVNMAFTSVEINITMSYKSQSPDWQYSQSKKTTIGIRN
ncbi:MAG: prepilin-type N-terminal cleavage/methylation domain-containing protein [Patescibacteria group bacterium]